MSRNKNNTSIRSKKSELNSGQQHSKYPTNASKHGYISNSNKSERGGGGGAESFAKNVDGTVSVGLLPNVQFPRNPKDQNYFGT